MSSKVKSIEGKVEEYRRKIESLKKDVSNCVKSVEGSNRQNSSVTFVVKNLIDGQTEYIRRKVNALIKDGLKLTISVTSAEQILSKRPGSYPGIVIVQCDSVTDRQKIMGAKAKLKDSQSYSNVFIEYCKTKEQRSMEASMRAVQKVIGKNKHRLNGSF